MTSGILPIFSLVFGVVLGAIAAWLAAQSQNKEIGAELRDQISQLQRALQSKEQAASSLQQEIRKESGDKVAAQTELANARRQLEDERKLFQDAEDKLKTAFDALAHKALNSNNQAFLDLAKGAFETIQVQAKGDLDTRQQAIDGLVRPLKESLGRYEKQVQDLEKSRQTAYVDLGGQLSRLQQETGNLNIALRGSHTKVRGRWGELTLHRVAELAGMVEHCDFDEQESFTVESGKQRPDMIVNLPGGRRIPVDSKVPLEAFLNAVSASTEEERRNYLAQHCRLVRGHMDRLAKQAYSDLFTTAPDLVFMFLPGESFLSAALESDDKLLENAIEKRVMLATPTILIALLLAVHHGWQQESLAKNAKEIKERGKELCERIKTAAGHFEALGSTLGKTVENYNQAISSLESRFFPSARKLKDLVLPMAEEIAVLEPVEKRPRPLTAPDWETNSSPRESNSDPTDVQFEKRASGL